MSSVSFTVTNTTTISNEVVVVRLSISDASLDAKLAEWQVLRPGSGGGSASFTFEGVITAMVSDGTNNTAAVPVPLGQLLSVTSNVTGGLQLAAAGSGPTQATAYVRNDSSNPQSLTVSWFVDGALVLTEPGLNQKASATFALSNTLLFSLRTLRARSASMLVQTDAASFTIKDGTTNVTVTWSRNGTGGMDVFAFDAT
ncbi:MAG TPA: hypothetical protein VGQ76_03490 [Thermoanaerobaculia bacterium]|jgi:hypothetical protein|nr:hypothetical protein [Thermoanaerobaculia bacterium]